MKLLITILLSVFYFSAQADMSSDLEGKLKLQYKKYNNLQLETRALAIQDREYFDRQAWEQKLTVPFSTEEIQSLKKEHQIVIQKSYEKALQNSVIAIDSFRQDKSRVTQFCSILPKGGMLHVHPDGTMDRTTVSELLNQGNPTVDGASMLSVTEGNNFRFYGHEELFLSSLTPALNYLEFDNNKKKALQELFFLPKEPYSHDFSRFMAFFFVKGIVHRRMDGDRNASGNKIYKDFFKRAKDQKVSYVEFTASLAPKVWTLKNLERWEQIGQEYGVTAKWNISFYRNVDAKENEEKMKLWIEFLKSNPWPKQIVGIDFLADESTNPALEKGQGVYIQALNAAKPFSGEALPLNRTMHAGELGNPNNVRDAMILGAQRVGHGVKLWQDPVALEYARRVRLGIETNLVSNIRLKVVDDIKTHPFLNFLRLGIPVSFSTDDEGLFETTMNKECEVAIANTNIQYSELKQIAINSIETSFADGLTKQKIKTKLIQEFLELEQDWILSPAFGD